MRTLGRVSKREIERKKKSIRRATQLWNVFMRSLCAWGLYFCFPTIFFFTFARTAIVLFQVVNCHCLKCDFVCLSVYLSFQFVLYCVTALSCYVNVNDKLISFPRSFHHHLFFVVVVEKCVYTAQIWMFSTWTIYAEVKLLFYFIGVFFVYVWVVILVLYSFSKPLFFSFHLCGYNNSFSQILHRLDEVFFFI